MFVPKDRAGTKNLQEAKKKLTKLMDGIDEEVPKEEIEKMAESLEDALEKVMDETPDSGDSAGSGHQQGQSLLRPKAMMKTTKTRELN